MGNIAEGDGRARFLSEHEASILRRIPNSFRGIRHPDLVLLGDIATEIKDKVVGDLGSGLGGLAKTSHIEGIPGTIWSINPHLAQASYIKEQRDFFQRRTALVGDYPDITTTQMQEAQDYHDAHTSTNFAHNFADFPDGFFDLLIDNCAVHAYMPFKASLVYEVTIDEVLRVLRPGGKMIVGHGIREDIWEETGMGRRALDKRGVKFKPIYHPNLQGWQSFPGVTIFKPAT